MSVVSKLKNNNYIKAIFAFLSPLFICMFFCAVRGTSLLKIYIPNAINNDCLYYYKIVEGVINYGIPQGYFGYNESHALYGTFASWNPLIVGYWGIWGKVFGWNYASAIVSNIIALSVAFGLFAYITKPKWSGLLSFLGLMLVFPAFSINVLNVLVEAPIGALLIIFFAFSIREARLRHGKLNISFMLICSFMLTLLRPYMVLLFLVPIIFVGRKKRIWSIPVVVIAVASVVGYFLCGHFFTSDYIYPVFDMTSIDKLLAGDIRGCLSTIKYAVIYTFPEAISLIKDAFVHGHTVGTQYVVTLFTAVMLIVIWVKSSEKKEKTMLLAYGIFAFVLFAAVIIFYRTANDGGRHFLIFAIVGCLLLCTECEGSFKWTSASVAFVLLIIFALRGSFYPRDYDVPFENKELEQKIEYWEKTFKEREITIDSDRYNNTVIWTLTDDVDGEYVSTYFNELYALPVGLGLNCCESVFLENNFDSLKSRYMAVTPGSETEKLCASRGWNMVGSTDTLAIYER